MKRIFYLLVLICISQVIYSQSDFREGFIINLNRDTTAGMIKYKEGNAGYSDCQFKEPGSNNIITYQAADIIGYGFRNDRYFESKKIDTEKRSSQFVFLEVLVHGKVSLYKYDKVFYVEKTEYGLLNLSNKSVESTVDGRTVMTQSGSYHGVLNLLLSDSPEMSSRVPRTVFSEKSLTDLIEKYNNSMNSEVVVYKENKPWVHARFGVTGGFISSKIALEASNGAFDHLGPFRRSGTPLFGATFELSLPRTNERWSLHSDFLFTKSAYDSFNEQTLFGKTTKNWATIDLTLFKIPIGIKYTFNGKKLSSFLSAGLSQTITLNSKTDWTQTVKYNTLFDTYNEEALGISKTQPGIWGGIGLVKPVGRGMNAYIEFRFEKTDGINSEDFLAVTKANVTNFQLIIGLTTK